MPGLYPQKRNTSLVEAYLELTGIKDNCYCHNSGFLVPCPCHKQPCPPRHEDRALWTYINFVFWMLLNNPMLNSCQIYHVDREGLSSKMELSGWQHPRSWLTRTCLPLKTLLKALTLGNVNLTHPQALQCLSRRKSSKVKDLTHFCFDERWMVEYPDISISVEIGIQHVWSTRWSQFSSRKRRIWEARTSWKKNKYGTTFCHSEKKTTHSYGTLHLPKEEPCQMHSS